MVDETYTLDSGDALQQLDWNSTERTLHGYGVTDGCDVTINTGTLGSGNNALTVGSGSAIVARTSVSIASQATDLPGADTQPRWDVVGADSSGSVVVRSGTPEEAQIDGEPTSEIRRKVHNPIPPFDPDIMPFALIWIPAGASSIESGDMFDVRVPTDAHVASISGAVADGSSITDLTGSNLFESGGSLSAANMRTDVQDNGTGVVSNTTTLNFGTNVSVTDPGDGSATIDGVDTVSRADKTFGPFVNGGHSDFSTAQDAVSFTDTTSHTNVVVFPPGDYGAITIPQGVTVRSGGRGRNSNYNAVFTASDGPAVLLQGAHSAIRHCAAENTSSPAAGEHAVEAAEFNIRIEGMFILGAGDDGIHLTGADYCDVQGCYAVDGNITSDGLVLDSDTAAAVIANNPGIGTIVDNGTNNAVGNNT